MLTTEGTQQVIEEKVTKITKTLTVVKQKDDLNDKQQAFITRQQSTLDRINNPFPRPSKPNYQGQPSILVGVSFGLEKPVTVAVVDVVKNEVLAYRSVKQLLGENYNLLNRQRQQQQRLSHEQHKAQKQNAPNSFGESELGQYIDRLLADWKVFSTCVYCFANCCFCYTFIDIFLNRRVERRTSFGSLMIFGIISRNVVKSTPINQNSDTNLRKLSIIKLPI